MIGPGSRWACVVVVTLAGLCANGCYYASEPGDPGGGADAGTIASTEFPCEVAKVLSTCWGCHSSPPRGGAPMSLTTFSDLSAMSGVEPGLDFARRALVRMRQSTNPMPPVGMPRPDAASIDAFAAWIDSGMPPGTCEGVAPPPSGEPVGPAPTICSSNAKWPLGAEKDPDMNPGLACRSCHLNVKPERAFFFMGTAFPTLHEEDRCFSIVPVGTRVEIIDRNGRVALTMPVRARGNFFSDATTTNIALPFTARVITPSGAVSQMMTPQMTGDCNSCHTEQGANGAPGRVLLPALN